MVATFNSLYLPSFTSSPLTCSASSLVGVKTSACNPFLGVVCSITPQPKARVFPEPVADSPITSFLFSMCGILLS